MVKRPKGSVDLQMNGKEVEVVILYGAIALLGPINMKRSGCCTVDGVC